jgi:predicted TIM-barrel fold metal-dependent hydrolase
MMALPSDPRPATVNWGRHRDSSSPSLRLPVGRTHTLDVALAAWLLAIPGLLAAEDAPPHYKSDYRIINVHYHGASATEAALQAELGVMDRVGIDMVVILDGDSPRGSLPAWLELQKNHPDRLAVLAKADFRDVKQPTFFADLVTNLERQARLGIKGVKVWKDLGMWVRDVSGTVLAVDDPRLDPFWEKCGELGLPVLIHTADPKEYWAPIFYDNFFYGIIKDEYLYYHDPGMIPWDELMRQRDHVLEKHPRTKFIGAHFGSLDADPARLGRTFDRYPNFSVDCAGASRLRRLAKLNPPAVRVFCTKYQDRLLFGADDAILSGGRGKPARSRSIPAKIPIGDSSTRPTRRPSRGGGPVPHYSIRSICNTSRPSASIWPIPANPEVGSASWVPACRATCSKGSITAMPSD